MMRVWAGSGVVAGGMLAVGMLGGCHGASEASPANLTKGVAKYLVDHPDCLYPSGLKLPYETSDRGEVKQLDTLVAAKLLANAAEPAIHITRYTVTDYGQKSAPRFCYGFRHVVGITGSTTPAKAADGFNESRVTYQYVIEDTPVWAKDAAVQAVYPGMAKALAGPGTATLTMAQTGVGWQVPE